MTAGESGVKEKAAEWSEKLQALAAKVPGLSEFMNRDNLREQDKLLREHTVKQLDNAKTAIDDMKRALLDKMQLRLLDDLDRLTQQIDRLRDKHRFDAYGYSGAFDANKILEPELRQLYEIDLNILAKVEGLASTCRSQAAGVVDEESAKPALASLKVDVGELARLIDSRRDSVNKLGL